MMLKKLAIACSFIALTAAADDRFANVEIKTTPIKGSVYMLEGSGGNIGVSAGEDGILIIDDQYAPLAERIAAALAEISPAPTRYVVNTHYHGDHTGSNAFFHEHKDATIFAHENVRVRLASDDKTAPATLPVVTYEDGVKFHFNGETIHVFHLPEAHTDGDSAVWFEQQNVLHTGDLFFNGRFPYIDLGAGGTVKGYIAAIETLLDKVTDDTIIIPGHGGLATPQDYAKTLDMIKQTNAYVQDLKRQGMGVEQIIEKGLPEEWADWSWRFINEERWIKTLY
ncbi:MBL fold metallo-hydrolase [Aestuariibacter salexigens]|uniref:MBL fold metallo-hydrolase n=1 Tax=Aestuariibacter salexigens TaxID=226010 RepID=UPI000404CF29|nr:MBL fold metallo-hydrolase [Aestuariibacter salexigens]